MNVKLDSKFFFFLNKFPINPQRQCHFCVGEWVWSKPIIRSKFRPLARSEHTATRVGAHEVYIFGGWCEEALSDLQVSFSSPFNILNSNKEMILILICLFFIHSPIRFSTLKQWFGQHQNVQGISPDQDIATQQIC